MQSFYAERFDREMGCTEREWLSWLPNAIGPHPNQLLHQAATVKIGDGQLDLTWQTGDPRVIALVSIPRLLVSFRFKGLDDAVRYLFMKRFDLYMQRGGG
jgi:hypothetical protein